jgi:transcription initiation factor IIE alpha subunit
MKLFICVSCDAYGLTPIWANQQTIPTCPLCGQRARETDSRTTVQGSCPHCGATLGFATLARRDTACPGCGGEISLSDYFPS